MQINICGKIILMHEDKPNEILLLKKPHWNLYEPVGGRLEVDFENKVSENIETCIIRECLEEINAEIKIESYLGNYHYFWTTDKKKYSFCLLFSGIIISDIKNLKLQDGSGACRTEVEWTNKNQIKEQNIPFSENHIGLKELIYKLLNGK